MLISPHLMQKSKNHMRHGMTEPVLPGPGAVTDEVMGKRSPAISVLVVVGEEGMKIVGWPSGSVIGLGVVIP